MLFYAVLMEEEKPARSCLSGRAGSPGCSSLAGTVCGGGSWSRGAKSVSGVTTADSRQPALPGVAGTAS